MIQEISKTIKLLFQTLGLGTEVIVKEVKPYAKLYTKGLLWLAMIAVLSPIPFLIIGITLDLRWLIALTGIWWALWAFLLLIMALPIGILIESLTDGIKGSGHRYIKRVGGILLVGLCISLFASLFPVKENLSTLPFLVLAAIILGILNVWFFSRKVISFLVSIIFIVLILSFYFPTTFKILGENISGIDISLAEPKRLYPTYESIEKGEFKFFRPDDKPRVWYYKVEDRRFELFDREGPHPTYKEKLKPVTPDIVPQIMKQLKEDAERKAEEGVVREPQKVKTPEDVVKEPNSGTKLPYVDSPEKTNTAVPPRSGIYPVGREFTQGTGVGVGKVHLYNIEIVDNNLLRFNFAFNWESGFSWYTTEVYLDNPVHTAFLVDRLGRQHPLVQTTEISAEGPIRVSAGSSRRFTLTFSFPSKMESFKYQAILLMIIHPLDPSGTVQVFPDIQYRLHIRDNKEINLTDFR